MCLETRHHIQLRAAFVLYKLNTRNFFRSTQTEYLGRSNSPRLVRQDVPPGPVPPADHKLIIICKEPDMCRRQQRRGARSRLLRSPPTGYHWPRPPPSSTPMPALQLPSPPRLCSSLPSWSASSPRRPLCSWSGRRPSYGDVVAGADVPLNQLPCGVRAAWFRADVHVHPPGSPAAAARR